MRLRFQGLGETLQGVQGGLVPNKISGVGYFANLYFVIRGAHLARSIIEHKFWEGLDRKIRIFRRVDSKKA